MFETFKILGSLHFEQTPVSWIDRAMESECEISHILYFMIQLVLMILWKYIAEHLLL